MTDGTDKVRLGFYQGSRSWHATTSLEHLSSSEFDEFMLGDYPEGGGCGPGGEFALTFGRFSNDQNNYVRLKVFDDAFALFDSMAGLKDFIKSGRCTTPEALRAFLLDDGFVDLTTEECPNPVMALRRSGLAKLDPEEIQALNLDADKLLPLGHC